MLLQQGHILRPSQKEKWGKVGIMRVPSCGAVGHHCRSSRAPGISMGLSILLSSASLAVPPMFQSPIKKSLPFSKGPRRGCQLLAEWDKKTNAGMVRDHPWATSAPGGLCIPGPHGLPSSLNAPASAHFKVLSARQ